VGYLARCYGQSNDSFEDVRQETLEFSAKCGETVLQNITAKLAIAASWVL
jgi:hypothetical protein